MRGKNIFAEGKGKTATDLSQEIPNLFSLESCFLKLGKILM
jgi:hypothetical protein